MMAMETSSPLAAMQPPSFARPWAQSRCEHSSFDSNFLRPPPYRPRNFDFNRMSMHKSNSDYFSFKPVRGSSPTQSLAVDLSQNFHIDQSPQVPTPRRSLFTSNLLADSRRQDVITPPIPSSSPGPYNDTMEVSPLPHKQPQPIVVAMTVCSPTPEATPADEEPMRPDIQRSESNPTRLAPQNLAEDRKPVRPTVRKGYSHNGQMNSRPRTATSSQAPFWFGPGSSMLSKAPPLETFMESPPSERKLAPSISNPTLVASPVSFNPTLQNGSPVPNARRPPIARGRSGIARRSQSMQCNDPYRPIRAEKRCCTIGSIQASLAVWEEPPKHRLPHFKPPEEVDALPRISMDTLLEVMGGNYDNEIGESAIIDCRFEYEYQGGHIEGALNFNGKEEMAKELFEKDFRGGKTLIFHCEYSAHRAPIMAKFIRQRDRAVNQDNYPKLTYPEIYILDGGYHNFFRNHPSRCIPQNYVEMDSKDHETACERGMAKVKRRGKLNRAQTYAFGQNSSCRQGETTVPAVPVGYPSLNSSFSVVEAMDVDFNSPIEVKFPSSSMQLDTSSSFNRPMSNSMRYAKVDSH